ncbi:MAG: 7-cyano-7-deazaguanine synthase [Rhizobiales bacterium]|nr:7-cyano-7-deazaguanine synthase [Hyphomicrobiales bacterium]
MHKKGTTFDVIALSGGIDSTALALDLMYSGADIRGIFIDSGQRCAIRQMAAVQRLSIRYQLPVDIADLPGTAKLYAASVPPPHVLFTEGPGIDLERPDTGPCWDSMKMVVEAGMFAATIGAHRLHYAVTKDDIDRVPNLVEGIKACERVIQLNTNNVNFSIEIPFISSSNDEVLKVMLSLDGDIFTWSCYWGGLDHCGECSGCSTRRLRYSRAGVADETVYSMKYT